MIENFPKDRIKIIEVLARSIAPRLFIVAIDWLDFDKYTDRAALLLDRKPSFGSVPTIEKIANGFYRVAPKDIKFSCWAAVNPWMLRIFIPS